MNLNKSTALTLRIGIVAGMVLMSIGLMIGMTGGSNILLYLGVLVLILSPFIGVIVTFISLVIERDWRWVLVAAVLISITTVGILINL